MNTPCAGCCVRENCPCIKVCEDHACEAHEAEQTGRKPVYADIGAHHVRDMVTYQEDPTFHGDRHQLHVSAVVTPGAKRLEVSDVAVFCASIHEASGATRKGCGVAHLMDEVETETVMDDLCAEYRDISLRLGTEQAKRQRFLEGTARLREMLETGARNAELEEAMKKVLEALPDVDKRIAPAALKGGAS